LKEAHHGSTPAEQRRDKRFALYIPIRTNWRDSNGQETEEVATATEVNAHGGVLQMSRHPSIGCEMRLTNALSGEMAQARAVAIRRARGAATSLLAVELSRPNEQFWGVNFRLKKSSAELVELEAALMHGNTDPRVLREFRDAVDYVRKTAWAVQEWHERQLKARDTSTVLPLLTSERIRRTTQLCKSIIEDLQSREMHTEPIGIDELCEAMESLSNCLVLFRSRQS
jgi:hypothetical protein